MSEQPFDQRFCTNEERTAFLSIQKAVLEPAPKTIKFTYTKDGGERSERHVEPYEVKGGDKPQLVAWDVEKDALRRFLLSGIEDVVVGEPFKARYAIKIPLG